MKRTFLVVLALTFALSCGAFAKSLGLPNQLINGSFEFGDDTAWLREGGDIVDLPSWFGNPGPAPGEADTFGYGVASCWGIGDGQITQDVYVAPGEYTVDLSGWLWAADTGGFESYVELQLLIDDQVVDVQHVGASGSMSGWTYVEISWTGFVAGKQSARLVGHADGREDYLGWGAGWGIVAADGIDLEAGPGGIVPEPASFLVLLGGLAAIRRRK